jgi:hypothetical protein
MQIIAKGGSVRIKLTQDEGRRMRDASYIAKRAAVNLSDETQSAELKAAAELILKFANEHTPSQEKLDRQDKQAPDVPVKE